MNDWGFLLNWKQSVYKAVCLRYIENTKIMNFQLKNSS